MASTIAGYISIVVGIIITVICIGYIIEIETDHQWWKRKK